MRWARLQETGAHDKVKNLEGNPPLDGTESAARGRKGDVAGDESRLDSAKGKTGSGCQDQDQGNQTTDAPVPGRLVSQKPIADTVKTLFSRNDVSQNEEREKGNKPAQKGKSEVYGMERDQPGQNKRSDGEESARNLGNQRHRQPIDNQRQKIPHDNGEPEQAERNSIGKGPDQIADRVANHEEGAELDDRARGRFFLGEPTGNEHECRHCTSKNGKPGEFLDGKRSWTKGHGMAEDNARHQNGLCRIKAENPVRHLLKQPQGA